jgi:hypothetical protein
MSLTTPVAKKHTPSFEGSAREEFEKNFPG